MFLLRGIIESPAHSAPSQLLDWLGSVPLNFYTPRQTYQLDTFNSIVIRTLVSKAGGGQIYNLLDEPIPKDKPRKDIKCNCTNSRCVARYCMCFSKGRKCTGECGCLNCSNQNTKPKAIESEEFKGCRCEKSECQKYYCECRKEGLRCSDKCKCKDCKNTTEEGVPSRAKTEKLVECVHR